MKLTKTDETIIIGGLSIAGLATIGQLLPKLGGILEAIITGAFLIPYLIVTSPYFYIPAAALIGLVILAKLLSPTIIIVRK